MFFNPLLTENLKDFIIGSRIEFSYDKDGMIQKILGQTPEGAPMSELNFYYQDKKLVLVDVFARATGMFRCMCPEDKICGNFLYSWENGPRLRQFDGNLTVLKCDGDVWRATLQKQFDYKNARLAAIRANGDTVSRSKYDPLGRAEEETFFDHKITLTYDKDSHVTRVLTTENGDVRSEHVAEYMDKRLLRSFLVNNKKWSLDEEYFYDDNPLGCICICDSVKRLWFMNGRLVCKMEAPCVSGKTYHVEIQKLLEMSPDVLARHLPPCFGGFFRSADGRHARVIGRFNEEIEINQEILLDNAGKILAINNEPSAPFQGYLDLHHLFNGSPENIMVNCLKNNAHQAAMENVPCPMASEED